MRNSAASAGAENEVPFQAQKPLRKSSGFSDSLPGRFSTGISPPLISIGNVLTTDAP